MIVDTTVLMTLDNDKGHLPLVVAASDGAFDRHFSGHCRNFTTTEQIDSSDLPA